MLQKPKHNPTTTANKKPKHPIPNTIIKINNKIARKQAEKETSKFRFDQ